MWKIFPPESMSLFSLLCAKYFSVVFWKKTFWELLDIWDQLVKAVYTGEHKRLCPFNLLCVGGTHRGRFNMKAVSFRQETSREQHSERWTDLWFYTLLSTRKSKGFVSMEGVYYVLGLLHGFYWSSVKYVQGSIASFGGICSQSILCLHTRCV